MSLRIFSTIVLSIICGGLLGSLIMSICISTNIISIEGGGVVPTPNVDKTLIIIFKGFFGGIFGLFTSVIAIAVAKQELFSKFKLHQILLLTLGFGLIHSAIFTILEYDNALYGQQTTMLTEFQQRIIINTAVIEFIAGCLIGLASILLVKFLLKTSDNLPLV